MKLQQYKDKLETKLDREALFEKGKKTFLERYGSEYYFTSDEFKVKRHKEIREKMYNTKKCNNSFHISRSEQRCYGLCKLKYPDTIGGSVKHIDERYCGYEVDLYVPSKDLFIELNFQNSFTDQVT